MFDFRARKPFTTRTRTGAGAYTAFSFQAFAETGRSTAVHITLAIDLPEDAATPERQLVHRAFEALRPLAAEVGRLTPATIADRLQVARGSTTRVQVAVQAASKVGRFQLTADAHLEPAETDRELARRIAPRLADWLSRVPDDFKTFSLGW